jgi:hypothetical protein
MTQIEDLNSTSSDLISKRITHRNFKNAGEKWCSAWSVKMLDIHGPTARCRPVWWGPKVVEKAPTKAIPTSCRRGVITLPCRRRTCRVSAPEVAVSVARRGATKQRSSRSVLHRYGGTQVFWSNRPIRGLNPGNRERESWILRKHRVKRHNNTNF